MASASARAQVLEFATHDATTTIPAVAPFPPNLPWDGWADVKSPGDGRTYAVGATRVAQTLEFPTPPETPPTFSWRRVENPAQGPESTQFIALLAQPLPPCSQFPGIRLGMAGSPALTYYH